MLEPHAMSRPMDQANAYGHSRTRTTSSNIFPGQSHQQQQYQHQQQYQPQYQHQHQHQYQQGNPQYAQAVPPHMQHSRRSPSVNTFSTTSSMQPPAAYRTSSSTDLRRSTSSRSGGTTSQQPASYVALLRRQKATVWCDRAQYEDPRVAAQQRAAKMRANLEVVGGGRGTTTASRTNTGISTTGKVAAKIRHHGKTPVVGYAPGENHVGVGGVPLRLSATEVEGESSDDDEGQATSRTQHRRTGSSGRSSIGSGRRAVQYRASVGSATIGGTQRGSPGNTPERSGSLADQPQEGGKVIDDAASGRAQSSRSASSGERADNVGDLGNIPKLAVNSQKHSALTREKSVKTAEELKRRGSVDERTATLTSQRLYIANPD